MNLTFSFRVVALLTVCAIILLCASCTADAPTNEVFTTQEITLNTEATSDGPQKGDVVDTANDGRLRVLIASDLHYTYLRGYYDRTRDERMQKFVDDVNAEHEKSPLDLIIIAGDISLDHWGTGGSWTVDKISDTKAFVDKFVPQLPEGVPVFILPGNHEQYHNEQWKMITGHSRQTYYATEGNLFIMLDNFRETLEPNYGSYSAPDSVVDTEYIRDLMALYPDHNVWLIAHYFHLPIQTETFKYILRNDRVKGLFQGHTHVPWYETLNEEYGNKIIATCGSYAEPGTSPKTEEDLRNCFWGFRELNITPEAATSSYIVTETTLKIANIEFYIPYRKVETVIFYR